MKREGPHTPEHEQRRLDRVVIAAAVAALFGPKAVVRRVAPASQGAFRTWLREGRLGIQASHRMPRALARAGPDRERTHS